MKQTLRYLLCGALALNGLAMVVAPVTWFNTVPGVRETGPLNLHLVRDVGCAYLVAAMGAGWHALRGKTGQSAATLGAVFLLLHAGTHLWEVAVGICGWGRFVQDTPGVVLPGVMALWLSLGDKLEARHA